MKSAAHPTLFQKLRTLWEAVINEPGIAGNYINPDFIDLADAQELPCTNSRIIESDIAYFCRVAGLEKEDITKRLKQIPAAKQIKKSRLFRRLAKEAEGPIEQFLRTHRVYDEQIETQYRLWIFSEGPQLAAARANMVCALSMELQKKILDKIIQMDGSNQTKLDSSTPPEPSQ